ncbi:MAG: PepSY domain-containing protein, partial [Parvibaculaceae bacterium]|nr:PepSY domain-containing protein [Parvibaculaceae bacterium]
DTPLTERLIQIAVVDATTAQLMEVRDIPWYIKGLFLSVPLHFGDYGGLFLKIIWALLDIAAIIVLGSGIYLWLGRRTNSRKTNNVDQSALMALEPAE